MVVVVLGFVVVVWGNGHDDGYNGGCYGYTRRVLTVLPSWPLCPCPPLVSILSLPTMSSQNMSTRHKI